MALHYTPGCGPQQGPNSDQEHEQAKAEPLPQVPHQAHQVSAEHYPRCVALPPNDKHTMELPKATKNRKVLKFIKKRVVP